MKTIVALFALCLALMPIAASAQTLTPPEARATLTMARAQATAASELATANAPTSTPLPTMTPQPTWTPLPTATETPLPTATPRPTETAMPTATMQPSATTLPIVATAAARTIDEPASDDRRIPNVPVELWCIAGIVLICAGIGVAMRTMSKWRK